jgi:hypothetical protein
VPRFNQLQAQYQADGLEMLSVNYANTDAEIQNFITTYGANYSFARVVDDSGYTVPIASTVFAIDRQGRVLWSGLSSAITDTMVEGWLEAGQGGSAGDDDGDDDEAKGCAARSEGSMVSLALIGALAAYCHRRRAQAGLRQRFSPKVQGLRRRLRRGPQLSDQPHSEDYR